MKGDDLSQRATQALQPFRHLGTPVEDDGVAAARRDELVPLIGGKIRAVSARRIRWRRGKRALGVAAVAAGLALVVAQSFGLINEDQRTGSRALAKNQQRLLLAGDRVATPSDAAASLVLAGGARAEVDPSTRITLVRTDAEEQRLKLELGRVELVVPKLAPGSAFVVETPEAEVRVRGTRFSVEVSGAGAAAGVTRVGVSQGSVLVRTARGEHLLSGGETWSSAPAAAVTEPARGAVFGSAAASAVAVPKNALAASPGAGAAPAPGNPPAAPGQRVAAPLALGNGSPQRQSSETPAPDRTHAAEGTGARPAGDSDALAQQNGLMQTALAARSNGDHAQAVRLLDELLRRHPSSPLIESARVERFRSLRRLGRHAEASREARRYLASYARGFARDEARRLILDPTER
jgi:hypothetical protein